MLVAKPCKIHSRRYAVDNSPRAADHDPLGAMGAAQHERCNQITCAGKAQFVKIEKSEISLVTNRDRADVAAPDALCGSIS